MTTQELALIAQIKTMHERAQSYLDDLRYHSTTPSGSVTAENLYFADAHNHRAYLLSVIDKYLQGT